MAAGRCSELAGILVELARHHVKMGASDLDTVVSEMQQTIPGITRTRLADSIVEYQNAGKVTLEDFHKRLARVKREARTDKQLRDKIEELEVHLRNATAPKKGKKASIKRAEAIQQLMDAKNELVKQLDRSEPVLRDKYKKQIKDSYKRLEDLNFNVLPEPKSADIEGTKELQRLRFERNRVQTEVRKRIEQLRPKSKWEKIPEWMNAPKALVASGEFSGVLRQGKFALFAQPGAGIKAVRDMVESFSSEQRSFEAHQRIINDADMPALAKAGLHITELDGPLAQQEEQIMSRWAGSIPVFGRFNRAYNTFLNSLRVYGAKGFAEYAINGEPTAQEWKDIANVVNVFTGRGSLGPFEQSSVALNAGLFSPRYQMSRIQILAGQPIWGAASPEVRRAILARFYGRALVGQASLYMLYGLLFGQEDKYKLTFNPLSSSFGKIQFGDAVLDPLAGLAQPVVFLNRAVRGRIKTRKGKERELRGKQVRFGETDIVSNYVRSKLSPVAGTTWDLIKGEDVVGNPTTIGGELLDMTVPMTYTDIYDVMKSDEIGLPAKSASSILSFFGEGVNVYSKRK